MTQEFHHYEFGFTKNIKGSVKCKCHKNCFCFCGCMTSTGVWLSKKMKHEVPALKTICLRKLSLKELRYFCETKNIDFCQLTQIKSGKKKICGKSGQ